MNGQLSYQRDKARGEKNEPEGTAAPPHVQTLLFVSIHLNTAQGSSQGGLFPVSEDISD